MKNENSEICAICGNKTEWDESFGKSSFIVCPKCFKKIIKRFREAYSGIDAVGQALTAVLAIGEAKDESEKEAENANKQINKKIALTAILEIGRLQK